jgi:hypothetical protein
MKLTKWGVGNARTTNDLITREEWIKRERRAELRDIFGEVILLIALITTCVVVIARVV